MDETVLRLWRLAMTLILRRFGTALPAKLAALAVRAIARKMPLKAEPQSNGVYLSKSSSVEFTWIDRPIKR